MLGSFFTANLVFAGAVDGLIIAVMAMGIVLVYRSSRVINFAAGELGVPAAALLAIMVTTDKVPYWIALVAALAVGTAAGAVVELVVIRRLAHAPRVIVLVATIGVAEFAQAVTTTLPGYRRGDVARPEFPTPIASRWSLGSIRLDGSQLLTILVVPLIVVALWLLLGRTRFGEAVRACATNVDLARLSGISPKLVSNAIWSIAGFLSVFAVVLWATAEHSSEIVAIGPNTLLLGLAAALVGRMTSFPWTFAGAIGIGVLYRLIFFNFGNVSGLSSFVLFLLVLVLVARMRRSDDTGAESFAFAPRVPPIPEQLRSIWWVRHLPRLIGLSALVVAAVVPLVITRSDHQFTYTLVLGFAICTVSVTVLTGWAGQLSLGQMAFAGVGALSAAAFVRGVSLNIGWHSNRIVQGSLPPLPFGVAVLLGAAVACVFAVGVGIGALRVKGLLLAISTLAFAIAAEDYLFHRPLFSGEEFAGTVEFRRGRLGPFDLTVRNRAYYYAVLATLVVVVVIAARLRRSGIGRMIIGVRENEPAAAALTVSPTRAKLFAFATRGILRGDGRRGAGRARSRDLVHATLLPARGFAGRRIGSSDRRARQPGRRGRRRVVGVRSARVLAHESDGSVAHVEHRSVDHSVVRTGRLHAVRLLAARHRVPPARAAGRRPTGEERDGTANLAGARFASDDLPSLNADGSVLATRKLTVKFGGLTAVNSVDFHAASGEVVALIGTNGAGKSTLLNAIGGFVASTGSVELLGREVSDVSAHRRVGIGLGRTFQAATLFPELTVRETVELALEARGGTSYWGTVLLLPAAMRRERAKRAEATELIDFLGLGRYADRFVAELSTGTRRIVELAAVLGVAPRVVCLDEPTAGVAQREAEAFAPLIKRVQQELGATLIIVEHDLPLVLGISDRVYCLEAGAVIAEGTPTAVREHPQVIASYLGTDRRAIDRSNAAPPVTEASLEG